MRLWTEANDESFFSSLIRKSKDVSQKQKNGNGNKVHVSQKRIQSSLSSVLYTNSYC